jgi:hypothetical protein
MVLKSPAELPGSRADGAILGVAHVPGTRPCFQAPDVGGEHAVADREFPFEGSSALAWPRGRRPGFAGLN